MENYFILEEMVLYTFVLTKKWKSIISVARNKVQTHRNAAHLECSKEKCWEDIVNENFGLKRQNRDVFI